MALPCSLEITTIRYTILIKQVCSCLFALKCVDRTLISVFVAFTTAQSSLLKTVKYLTQTVQITWVVKEHLAPKLKVHVFHFVCDSTFSSTFSLCDFLYFGDVGSRVVRNIDGVLLS